MKQEKNQPEQIVRHVHRSVSVFVPGIYRHYKGNHYRALFIAQANEFTDPPTPVVVYVSLTNGKIFTRPYNSNTSLLYDTTAHDAWNDDIGTPDKKTIYVWQPRFLYVGQVVHSIPE